MRYTFELFLCAMQCYLFSVWCFYHIDVCRVTECTECYPHTDPECPAAYSRSSKYTVSVGLNEGNYSLYLAATQFAQRDSWIISSCGYCYTCTEYLPNDSVTCYYSSSNIQRTLTTSSLKYFSLYFIILIMGVWLCLFLLTCVKDGPQDAGLIANEAKFRRMNKI